MHPNPETFFRDAQGVQRLLDAPLHFYRHVAQRLLKIWALEDADTMLI